MTVRVAIVSNRPAKPYPVKVISFRCVSLEIAGEVASSWRNGMTMGEAITTAKEQSAERIALGFDQVALDQAARQGFAEGAFEESDEEGGRQAVRQ